jgi:hypothetical protein
MLDRLLGQGRIVDTSVIGCYEQVTLVFEV